MSSFSVKPKPKIQHPILTFYFDDNKKLCLYNNGINGDKQCGNYLYFKLYNIPSFHSTCDTNYKMYPPVIKAIKNGYVKICHFCDCIKNPKDVKIKTEDNKPKVIKKESSYYPIDNNGVMFSGIFSYKRRNVIRVRPNYGGDETDDSSDDYNPDNTVDDGMKPLPLYNFKVTYGM